MGTVEDYMVKKITEQITEKVAILFQTELKKVELEFQRMETYINTLEDRVEKLEKLEQQSRH
jgi:hypothetical protein